jgi:hypothetical protein
VSTSTSRSATQRPDIASANSTIRRRSAASASAPPTSAINRIATNSTAPSTPTSNVECVSR